MIFPFNQKYLECVQQIPGGINILGELNLVKLHGNPKIEWNREGSLYYTTSPSSLVAQSYLALFDVDWTITFAQKKLLPHWAPDDIELLPGRQKILEQLIKMGYTLIFVTNQLVKGKTPKSDAARMERVERITNFMRKLSLPCMVFIATGDDNYRKPHTGIWEKISEMVPKIDYSFFVGDALGRPQDFADTDRKFAENIGIPWYSPEDIFPPPRVVLPKGKNLVITVGAPGTGKSSYSLSLNYSVISSDNYKSNKKKILAVLEDDLKKGVNGVVVDATNPKQEDREVYYELAQKYGYNIVVLYFVRDGAGWNKLRGDNRVPTMAYHKFFSNLVPPTRENTPGQVFLIP